MSLHARAEEVLGINSRNIDFIAPYNRRCDYPIADDKVRTKEILAAAGIAHARLHRAYRWFYELGELARDLSRLDEFVMKPARGMAGGGILILERKGDLYNTPSGKTFTANELVAHATNILYGAYSIDNTTDTLIVEERIHPHPFFARLAPAGVADVRVVVFRGEAIMAMSRIPTKHSDGKANLALGAVGAGIDMATGTFTRAATKRGPVTHHPDTGRPLVGETVPLWPQTLSTAIEAQRQVPLGYVGVDLVIDARRGPLVLELNVRPGLEIQNVTGKGLRVPLVIRERNLAAPRGRHAP